MVFGKGRARSLGSLALSFQCEYGMWLIGVICWIPETVIESGSTNSVFVFGLYWDNERAFSGAGLCLYCLTDGKGNMFMLDVIEGNVANGCIGCCHEDKLRSGVGAGMRPRTRELRCILRSQDVEFQRLNICC